MAESDVSLQAGVLDHIIENTDSEDLDGMPEEIVPQVQMTDESENKLNDTVLGMISDVVAAKLDEILGDFGHNEDKEITTRRNSDTMPNEHKPDNLDENPNNGILDDIIKETEKQPEPSAKIPPPAPSPQKENDPAPEQSKQPQNAAGLTPEQEEAVQKQMADDQEKEMQAQEEENEQDEQPEEEKGIVTTTINRFRYSSELRNLKKQFDELGKRLKGNQKAIRSKTNSLKLLNLKKWPLKALETVLDLISGALKKCICCGGCCILGFLVPAMIISQRVIATFLIYLKGILEKIDKQIAALKQEITALGAQISIIQHEQKHILQLYNNLLNEGLLSGMLGDQKIQKNREKY